MLVTNVEVTGFDSFWLKVTRHKEHMSPARRTEASVAGAQTAKRLLTLDMHIPKSGIQWPNLPNRSSSPSETPAAQSGEMAREMKVSAQGNGQATLTADSPQALWMEYGFTTRDGAFHIRPWFRPGIDKYRDDINYAIQTKMRVGKEL